MPADNEVPVPVRSWNELVQGFLGFQEQANRLQRLIWQTAGQIRESSPPQGFERRTSAQGVVTFAATQRVYEFVHQEDPAEEIPLESEVPVDGSAQQEVGTTTREVEVQVDTPTTCEIGVQTDPIVGAIHGQAKSAEEVAFDEHLEELDEALPNFTKGPGGNDVCARCANEDCYASSPQCKAREAGCYHCGRRGHFSRICAMKRKVVCHKCKKEGHLMRHCAEYAIQAEHERREMDFELEVEETELE